MRCPRCAWLLRMVDGSNCLLRKTSGLVRHKFNPRSPHILKHISKDLPQPFMNKADRRRALVTGTAAAILLIGLAFMVMVRRNNAAQRWVDHTEAVLRSADRVIATLVDAETGQRGYLLTGQDTYLEPYTAGIKAHGAVLDTLRALTADNPAQQHRLDTLAAWSTHKRAELLRTIDVYRNAGAAAALAIVDSGQGRATMDSIRGIAGRLQAEETRLLGKREALERRRRLGVFLVAGIGTAAAVVLALLQGGLLSRAVRERETAAAQLASSNAELQATNEELEHTVDRLQETTEELETSNEELEVSYEEVTRSRDELAETVAQARAAHERTRTVLETTTDAYIGVDPAWQIAYANRRAAEALAPHGVDLARRLGQSLWEVWPETLGTDVESRYRTVMNERIPTNFEHWYQGYQRWYEVHAFPNPDGGIGVFFRDVTDRKRAEERAQHTQRMDAVGRLAGGVAHEVNNQMTVVLGTTEFLLNRPDLPEWARYDLDAIRHAAQNSAAVTSQLLSFGRRQMLHPQPLALNVVVAEMQPILQRTLGPNIQIQLELTPGVGMARVDHAQLTQALLNLAINARDAMPSGGTLRIETRSVELTAADTFDDGAETIPGTYLILQIADTGVGMDRTTLSRVFEPFFTTKPVGEGTGLGLAMVYGMVRQSEGYITVKSRPGKGTTFTIYLPQQGERAETVTAAAPAEAPAARTPEGGPRTVLVVEDEPLVRGILVRMLAKEGFEVLAAEDGADALALLQRVQLDGRLGLVVTDLAMPGMGGRELAERLRKEGYRVPLLFISGYSDEDIARLGLLAPGQSVLRKPFSPSALADRVRQLTMNEGNVETGHLTRA